MGQAGWRAKLWCIWTSLCCTSPSRLGLIDVFPASTSALNRNNEWPSQPQAASSSPKDQVKLRHEEAGESRIPDYIYILVSACRHLHFSKVLKTENFPLMALLAISKLFAQGRLFCFLPLPPSAVSLRVPMHVHALGAIVWSRTYNSRFSSWPRVPNSLQYPLLLALAILGRSNSNTFRHSKLLVDGCSGSCLGLWTRRKIAETFFWTTELVIMKSSARM